MIIVFSSWGDTRVSYTDLGQDKAPLSWPHLTRVKLQSCLGKEGADGGLS